jgi:uncharacterized protein
VRVTRLSVTPVKGLGLHHPEVVELDPSGAVGDRDLLLVDDRGRLLSVTRSGALLRVRATWDRDARVLALHRPDGLLVEAEVDPGAPYEHDLWGQRTVRGHVVRGPFAEVLSALAGVPLRLVLLDRPGSGSDVHPATLLGSASVDRLGAHLGTAVDARRFRMLLEVATDDPFAEDAWAGQDLEVGGAVLRAGGPVPRCAATTRHPDAGDRDVPIVRALRELRGLRPNELGRGANLGIYATVVRPGPVAVGDAVTVRTPMGDAAPGW